MHTYYEFTLVTQAGEYLVGIVGLLLFVPFWKALNPRKTMED
jgi:hypothetical protein